MRNLLWKTWPGPCLTHRSHEPFAWLTHGVPEDEKFAERPCSDLVLHNESQSVLKEQPMIHEKRTIPLNSMTDKRTILFPLEMFLALCNSFICLYS